MTAGNPIVKVDPEGRKPDKKNTIEMAKLSGHSYGDNRETLAKNWEEVSDEELRNKFRLTKKDLKDDKTGFMSQLYKCEVKPKINTYAYVFAGTHGPEPNNKKDIKLTVVGIKVSKKDQTNSVRQGAGFKSEQYEKAIENTEKILKALDNKTDLLQLAGHSLGGGLASAAGTIHGIKTTTFNASGVHKKTLWTHIRSKIISHRQKLGDQMRAATGKQKKSLKSRWLNATIDLAKKNVTAYYMENEILSTMQDKMAILPDAIGVRIKLTSDKEMPKDKKERKKLTIWLHRSLKHIMERMD